MIGNWLNNFPGNWFGYWFGYKEPDFLCNSSIEVVYESYSIKIVEELSLTWTDNNFELSTDECPTL